MADEAASLLVWIQNFKSLTVPVTSWDDVKDGVVLTEIMLEISPGIVDKQLLKYGAGTNRHLKLNNVRRLLDSLADFYQEEFGMDSAELHMPDAAEVVDDDSIDGVVSLTKLVLGAATFSSRKEEYLGAILLLEDIVMESLMIVMQKMMTTHPALMAAAGGGAATHARDTVEDDAVKQQCQPGMSELQASRVEYQKLLEQKHTESSNLNEEIKALTEQKQLLEAKVLELENYEDPATPSGRTIASLKTNQTHLGEQLYAAECERDLQQREAQALRQTVADQQARLAELQQESEELLHYRDEANLLRHKADQVESLEKAVALYKSKLQALGDWKSQAQHLETENQKLVEDNFQLKSKLERALQQRTELNKERVDVEALSQEGMATAQALTAAEDKARLLELRVAQQQQELAVCHETIEVLRHRLEELEGIETAQGVGEPARPTATLYDQLYSGKSATVQLEQELASAKEEGKRLQRALQEAQARQYSGSQETVVELQRKLDNLSEAHKRLVANAVKEEAKDKELLQQVKDLLLENRKLTKENRAWREDMERLTQKHQEVRQQNAGLQDSCKTLQARVQQLKQGGATREVHSHIQRLQDQLVEKDAELNALKTSTEKQEALWLREQQAMASTVYRLGRDIQEMALSEHLLTNAHSKPPLLQKLRQEDTKPVLGQ